MATIYLVFKEGGEFSERYSRLMKGWFSEENAQKHVLELQEEQKIFRELHALSKQFKLNWDIQNPISMLPSLEPIPKWKAGIGEGEITKEMRLERELIKERNQKITDEYWSMRNVHFEKRNVALIEYLLTINANNKFISMTRNTYEYSFNSLDLTAEFNIKECEVE